MRSDRGGARATVSPGAVNDRVLLSLSANTAESPLWRKCAISGSPVAFTYRCRPEGGPTPQIGQTGRSDRECARKLLLSGGGAGTNVSPDALTMNDARIFLACRCDYNTEIRNIHGFALHSYADSKSSIGGFRVGAVLAVVIFFDTIYMELTFYLHSSIKH